MWCNWIPCNMGLGKRMEDRRRWLNKGDVRRRRRRGTERQGRGLISVSTVEWVSGEGREGLWLVEKSPASHLLSSLGLTWLRKAVSSRPRPLEAIAHSQILRPTANSVQSVKEKEWSQEREIENEKRWVWAKMLMRAKFGNLSLYFLVPMTKPLGNR